MISNDSKEVSQVTNCSLIIKNFIRFQLISEFKIISKIMKAYWIQKFSKETFR